MAYCPADRMRCFDDMCYGWGCFRIPGEPMLAKCVGCGQLIAADGSDFDDCECEFADIDDDDDR